jgi:hypothetical protein
MKAFDVVLFTCIQEVVTVEARDEDDAAEIALQIVKAGYTVHSELDWDVEEVNIGDPADVTE